MPLIVTVSLDLTVKVSFSSFTLITVIVRSAASQFVCSTANARVGDDVNDTFFILIATVGVSEAVSALAVIAIIPQTRSAIDRASAKTLLLRFFMFIIPFIVFFCLDGCPCVAGRVFTVIISTGCTYNIGHFK